ncbi:tigger transposable element-derived protein 6-like [Dermacentor albipictus]|uniref:tigger transposable element-derived protein 6-like n=1 Tax=Dermacentor albipictus TaxID=60249 RepID=UPI0031FD773C
MVANAKKQTSPTFAAKLEVIQCVENGEKSNVAKAIDPPRNIFRAPLKNKSDIKAKAGLNQHSGTQRVHKAAFEDVEKLLHKWFIDARARNIPSFGPMPLQKAKNFAFILGAENFNASSSLLQRFKAHFNIVGKTASGESEDTNEGEIKKWLEHEWSQVLAKYEPNQIFNADETGLFWKMLPRQRLTPAGTSATSASKARLI